MSSAEKRSSTSFAPAAPIPVRRAGSPTSSAIAAASASGVKSPTTIPAPSPSRPAIPETGVETTGVPAASASSVAIDWPSEFEETTITSAWAISARASGDARR